MRKNIYLLTSRTVLSIGISAFVFFSACSTETSLRNDQYGGVSISLEWPDQPGPGGRGKTSVAPDSVLMIRISINTPYGFNAVNSFDAAQGRATIFDVPAGHDITVDVEGMDVYNYPIYRATMTGISVAAGEDTEIHATMQLQPPAAPQNLWGEYLGGGEVRLTWEDRSTTEDSFFVERRSAFGSSFTLTGATGPGMTSLSDFSAGMDQEYYYRVYAANAAGISDWSPEAYVVTSSQSGVPNAPSGLYCTGFSDRIEVQWIDNSFDEDGFAIERSDDNFSFYNVGYNGVDNTFFVDYGVTPGQTYYYRVAAYNWVGYSPFSDPDSATVNPGSSASLQYLSTFFLSSGYAADVAVTGTYGYAAVDNRIVVFSVSDPYAPYFVTDVFVADTVTALAVDMSNLFCAMKDSGLALYDIVNPASPVLRSSVVFPGSGAKGVEGVVGYGTYAYAALGDSGIAVVNVNNLDSMFVESMLTTASPAVKLFMGGQKLYSAEDYGGLHVYDVTSPQTPVHMGSITTSGPAVDLWVGEPTAYVAVSGGVEIIDVTNPNAPFSMFMIGTAFEVRTVAQYQSTIAFAEYGSALSLWTVTDPMNPYQSDYLPAGGNQIEESFTTPTGEVFFADGPNGIQIYRINEYLRSDP